MKLHLIESLFFPSMPWTLLGPSRFPIAGLCSAEVAWEVIRGLGGEEGNYIARNFHLAPKEKSPIFVDTKTGEWVAIINNPAYEERIYNILSVTGETNDK